MPRSPEKARHQALTEIRPRAIGGRSQRRQAPLLPDSGGVKLLYGCALRAAVARLREDGMCDQDHFEDDRQDFEARGLVTRRQFGVLLGAGVAMMLPQVANAVAVTESDVTIKTPDGTARLLLRAPGHRHGPRRAGLAGHLRPAPGVPADGQAARRIRLFGAGRESVLSRRRRRRPAAQRRGDADPGADAAGAGAERDDAHDRREGVHRAGSISSRRSPRTGRSARRATAWAARWRSAPRRPCPTASARSRRSTAAASSPTQPNSPHLQAAKTKAQFLVAIAAERRPARAEREERAEGDVREGEPAGRDRGLRRRRARLVPAGLGRLQRAAGREGVGALAGALRQGAGLIASPRQGGPHTDRPDDTPGSQKLVSTPLPDSCKCPSHELVAASEGGRAAITTAI